MFPKEHSTMTRPLILTTTFLTAATVMLGAALPGVCGGLFPRVRLPRINVGKGVKTVLSPVGKAAVVGGKAIVGVGKAVIKNGPGAVETYEEWQGASGKIKKIAP